ncbi:uncharacterized protein LOC119865855 isoform X4 [Canis lupus familiaris]|uniref:uncharacterized protein LOC119865855 isoform X4 n=1 Tax=Canis lupus familiaris TaxID=9615 RepID=UPI0018F56B8F|nr:uncharacterized protein LOC119865855 isoform X4 [Canis lupus familiaris]
MFSTFPHWMSLYKTLLAGSEDSPTLQSRRYSTREKTPRKLRSCTRTSCTRRSGGSSRPRGHCSSSHSSRSSRGSRMSSSPPGSTCRWYSCPRSPRSLHSLRSYCSLRSLHSLRSHCCSHRSLHSHSTPWCQ